LGPCPVAQQGRKAGHQPLKAWPAGLGLGWLAQVPKRESGHPYKQALLGVGVRL